MKIAALALTGTLLVGGCAGLSPGEQRAVTGTGMGAAGIFESV